ncbi:MAG: phosphoribosylamine--glycine ligase [Candidatus Acidiferrales bacterium]
MKILVIGGGGREHALVWKLRQSPRVEKIWCAPGNGGIADEVECLAANLSDSGNLADLAGRLGADLTLCGPELPLVQGVADEFSKRGLKIIGPTKKAAQLEGSKVFAKQFMQQHGIPTAAVYGIFHSAVDAYASVCEVDWPTVLKANGLCGGKGVLVTSSPDEATAFINRVMEERVFGEAGNSLIVEEGLEGEELSYIVLTDGETILPMAATRDHKRLLDGNQGPNTGGMGAFMADGLISAEIEREIMQRIVRPTVEGMTRDSTPYRGFLYCGLMLTNSGPKLLEYNCRMGDPETQALVMSMDFDLAEALEAATEGKLAPFRLKWKPGASACIVAAAEGYPGRSSNECQVRGLSRVKQDRSLAVFHAGTKKSGDNYYTCGGRILAVAGHGHDIEAAREVVYTALGEIQFEGMQFRRDIGEAFVPQGRAAGS